MTIKFVTPYFVRKYNIRVYKPDASANSHKSQIEYMKYLKINTSNKTHCRQSPSAIFGSVLVDKVEDVNSKIVGVRTPPPLIIQLHLSFNVTTNMLGFRQNFAVS
jgi:hypothetical protein